jgi:hypothetical protein
MFLPISGVSAVGSEVKFCWLVKLLQRLQHKLLDNFFSVLSCVVSVPFYTGFLPLLFWVCLVAYLLTLFPHFLLQLPMILNRFCFCTYCRVDTASWLGR